MARSNRESTPERRLEAYIYVFLETGAALGAAVGGLTLFVEIRVRLYS